ncbi:MAG: diguanylate cyclase [Ramlibacter sp.]|nr:diguanylate cyclase [Ramlibacter sp.]
MQEPASLFLVYVVFPLWVAAGFADWVCHVRTGISLTSGLKENLLHWLMFAEVGVGLSAVAMLEINAAVLLLVFAVFVVHELTVYWDLNYSTLVRDVGPFEQMVHSFLELLPLLTLALLMVMAPAEGPPDWSLRLKEQPLPVNYLAAALLVIGVFNVVPLFQETYACIRARTIKTRIRARPKEPAKDQPPGAAPLPDAGIEPTLDGARPPAAGAAKARTPPSPAPK